MVLVLIAVVIVTVATFARTFVVWIVLSRHLRRLARSSGLETNDEILSLYVIHLKYAIYKTMIDARENGEEFRKIVGDLAKAMARVFGCDSWSVILVPEGREWSYVAWSEKLDKVNLKEIARALQSREENNISDVIARRDVGCIEDTTRSANWKEFTTPVKRWVGVPLIYGGTVVGVVNLDWFEPGKVDYYVVESLRAVVPDLTNMLEKCEEFREMVLNFNVDVLVGIPDRKALEMFAEHVNSTGKRVGVVYIELENLRKINKIYGYSVGDEVLKAVVKRVEETFRRADRLFRYGGAELVLAVENVSPEALVGIQKKMESLFLRIFDLERDGSRYFIKVNARVGGAIFPDESDSLEGAIELARNRALA